MFECTCELFAYKLNSNIKLFRFELSLYEFQFRSKDTDFTV